MLFQPSMKKILVARGFHHCKSDDEFTRHGNYARNIQYVFSREFKSDGQKVVDLLFLAADMVSERLIVRFFRENVTVENGVLVNAEAAIPLFRLSIEEFELRLDRLIPKGNPLMKPDGGKKIF